MPRAAPRIPHSYKRSAPVPTPSPADSGEADASPGWDATGNDDFDQPGGEGAGQTGCRSAPRRVLVNNLTEEAFYGLDHCFHTSNPAPAVFFKRDGGARKPEGAYILSAKAVARTGARTRAKLQ